MLKFKKIDPILFLWLLCLILNIITFLFIHYKIRTSSKTLALHFNVLVGVNWYGNGQNLYSLPAAAATITFINFMLQRLLNRSGNFMAKLCSFASLCAQCIVLGAVFFLSRINV